MESIVAVELKLLCPRCPIHFIHSICFLFENEKTNWEWIEMKGLGAQGNSPAHEWNEWAAVPAERNGDWAGFVFEFGWVIGCGAAGNQPKEKTSQPNWPFFSFSSICEWRNEWTNWEEKWRDEIEEQFVSGDEWNEESELRNGICLSGMKTNGMEQTRHEWNEWSAAEPQRRLSGGRSHKPTNEENEMKANEMRLNEVDEFVGYGAEPIYRGATRFIDSFLHQFHSTSLLSINLSATSEEKRRVSRLIILSF